MNIFYLDKGVSECVKAHNDKHTVKMILEYAQILSTVHRVLDGKLFIDETSGRKVKLWKLQDFEMDSILYKATHINHPSTIWTRETVGNYYYLYNLFVELSKEFEYRFGKKHKSFIDLEKYLFRTPKNIPLGVFTEPTPAMPDEYKVPNDSLQSYRNYYNGDKQHLAKWTKRDIPEWFIKK